MSVTDGLPRVSLAFLPTPVRPLLRLSAELGGPEIWIKRDDQTGLATGGNKTRKLEFLIGSALAEEADCVITAGSTQSNHARQTAAAARSVGLEPHLVLRAAEATASGDDTRVSGNVLIDRLLGAVIHWTDEEAPYVETLQNVRMELQDQGRRPALVPYGGSNATGLMGYVRAAEELELQSDELPSFAAHVFASSSGGTQAGLVLGAHSCAWEIGRPLLLAISIDEIARDLEHQVTRLVAEGTSLLGMGEEVSPERIRVNDDYLGGGYAVVGDPEREAIRLAAETEGLLLDPVYTGRAMAGLIDLVRKGEFSTGEAVLFWHTGGIAALDAFGEVLLRS